MEDSPKPKSTRNVGAIVWVVLFAIVLFVAVKFGPKLPNQPPTKQAQAQLPPPVNAPAELPDYEKAPYTLVKSVTGSALTAPELGPHPAKIYSTNPSSKVTSDTNDIAILFDKDPDRGGKPIYAEWIAVDELRETGDPKVTVRTYTFKNEKPVFLKAYRNY